MYVKLKWTILNFLVQYLNTTSLICFMKDNNIFIFNSIRKEKEQFGALHTGI